jgi:hypothetical protein
MNAILAILLVVIIIAFIAGIIILVRTRFEREEFDYDVTEVKVWGMTGFTHGHSQGRLIKEKKGATRTLIEFMPYVTAEERKKNNILEVTPEIIVVENNKKCIETRGTNDSYVTTYHLFPSRGDDFHQDFHKTHMGKCFNNMVEGINNNKLVNEVIESRNATVDELLHDTAGLGMVRRYLKEDKALTADFKKKISDNNDDKKKTGSFSPFTGTSAK